MIKEKITKAGKLLNTDFYPCFDNGRKIPTKPPKTQGSTEAQKKYNNIKAKKELIYIINENFDEEDIIMHPTYKPCNAPQSEEKARRDMVNYIRRVKRLRAKELLKVTAALDALPDSEALDEVREKLKMQKSKLEAPLKYVYVIEKEIYQRGPLKGRVNWHFHMCITGGFDRKVYERMWTGGLRTNADQFQPEKFGPESIGKYMGKDPQGAKRFVCSRNIKRTYKQPKVKNSRFSKRTLAQLSQERSEDKQYWEKRYPGYRFVRAFPRYNEYNSHWYLTVVMYAAGDGPVPKWDMDNWPNDDWQNERCQVCS